MPGVGGSLALMLHINEVMIPGVGVHLGLPQRKIPWGPHVYLITYHSTRMGIDEVMIPIGVL